jgi:hypothetical protein
VSWCEGSLALQDAGLISALVGPYFNLIFKKMPYLSRKIVGSLEGTLCQIQDVLPAGLNGPFKKSLPLAL